jgi:hypothetical protein
MNIRLEGLPDECAEAVERLTGTFDVVSVSDPYPNRGTSKLVRVYVELRMGESGG